MYTHLELLYSNVKQGKSFFKNKVIGTNLYSDLRRERHHQCESNKKAKLLKIYLHKNQNMPKQFKFSVESPKIENHSIGSIFLHAISLKKLL